VESEEENQQNVKNQIIISY